MPTFLESRDDGHILYVKMTDPLDFQELTRTFTEEHKIRETSKFVMHSLVDVRELKRFPPGSITMGRRSPALNHPRRGHLVLIGAVAFLEAFLGTLARIVRFSNVKFVKSEEEGMAYLRKIVADEAAKNPTSKSEELPTAGTGGSSIA